MADVEKLPVEEENPLTRTRTLQEVKQIISADDLGSFIQVHLSLLNIVAQQGTDTLLMTACHEASVDCLDYLLDSNPNLNYQSKDGMTALMLAIMKDHPLSTEIVRKLLLKGANPNLINKKGLTALDVAFESCKNFETIQLLLEFGAESKQNYDVPLIFTLMTSYRHARNERVVTMNTQPMAMAFTNFLDFLNGVMRPPEREAPSLESKENLIPKEEQNDDMKKAVQLLYQREGSRWPLDYVHHEQTNDGNMILHVLVSQNQVEVLECLLNDRREEVIKQHYLDRKDGQERTPLMIALHKQHHQCALILIKAGTILKQKAHGKSMFEFAITCNATDEVLEAMLEHGAELVRSNWINWFLKYLREVRGMGRYLLDMGEARRISLLLMRLDKDPRNLTVIGQSRCTCNMQAIAADYGLKEIFDHFVKNQQPADLKVIHEMKCEEHGTMLTMALNEYRGKSAETTFHLAESLIKMGAPVTSELLTQIKDPKLAKVLLDHGCTPNIMTNGENTSIPFEQYHPMIWQTICIHSKYKPLLLTKNENELASWDDPEEVEPENFVRLQNGIFWDIENLYEYIVNNVQGVNKYDSKHPYAGEEIWTDNDLRMLNHHSDQLESNLGRKINEFVNVNDLLNKISFEILEQIEICSSVLKCDGKIFIREIKALLTPHEQDIWNELAGDQKDRMPSGLPASIGGKIQNLKQRVIFEFMEKYRPLPKEIKNEIANLNGTLTERYLTALASGNECSLSAGGYFFKAWQRCESWVNQIRENRSNDDENKSDLD